MFLNTILLAGAAVVIEAEVVPLHFSLCALGPSSAAVCWRVLQYPKDPLVPDPVHTFFLALLAMSFASNSRQSAAGSGVIPVMQAQQSGPAFKQAVQAAIHVSSSVLHLSLRVVFVHPSMAVISQFSFAEAVQLASSAAIASTVSFPDPALEAAAASNSPPLALSLFFSIVEQVLVILLSFLS